MKTIEKNGIYYIEFDFEEFQAIKFNIFRYKNEFDFVYIEYWVKDTVFYNEIFDINANKYGTIIVEIDRPKHIYKLVNLMIEKYDQNIFSKYLINLKEELEQNSLRRSFLLKKLKENIENGRNLEKNR